MHRASTIRETHTHTRTHTHTPTLSTHMQTRTHTHTYMHANTHTHSHLAHICKHAHTHTHTHVDSTHTTNNHNVKRNCYNLARQRRQNQTIKKKRVPPQQWLKIANITFFLKINRQTHTRLRHNTHH